VYKKLLVIALMFLPSIAFAERYYLLYEGVYHDLIDKMAKLKIEGHENEKSYKLLNSLIGTMRIEDRDDYREECSTLNDRQNYIEDKQIVMRAEVNQLYKKYEELLNKYKLLSEQIKGFMEVDKKSMNYLIVPHGGIDKGISPFTSGSDGDVISSERAQEMMYQKKSEGIRK